MRPSTCLVLVVLLAGLAPAQQGRPVPLPITPEVWRADVRHASASDTDSVVAPDDLALLEIHDTKKLGPTLVCGRLAHGVRHAYWTYQDALPHAEGTWRFQYRTESFQPDAGALRIRFLDTDGKVLATRVHRLMDAPAWHRAEVPVHSPPAGAVAMRMALGVVHQTAGRAFFGKITFTAGSPRLRAGTGPGKLARVLPWKNLGTSPRFCLKRTRGVWSFVTPQGKGWYALGLPGPPLPALPDGNEASARMLTDLRDHGYNCLSHRSHVESWLTYNRARLDEGRQPQRMFLSLDPLATPGEFARDAHGIPAHDDPAFLKAWRATVRARVTELADHDWIVAWILGEAQPWARGDREFQARVARVLRAATDVLREEDPGRLVLSPVLHAADRHAWFPVVDRLAFFDGHAVEVVPRLVSRGIHGEELRLLERIHERTRKPILVAKWNVPAREAGLAGDEPTNAAWHGRGSATTLAQRSGQAARITTDLYNQPYIVGTLWSDWEDSDLSNVGMVKRGGAKWDGLWKMMRKTHRRMEKFSLQARKNKGGR